MREKRVERAQETEGERRKGGRGSKEGKKKQTVPLNRSRKGVEGRGRVRRTVFSMFVNTLVVMRGCKVH